MAYGKGNPASFAYTIGSTPGCNPLFRVCLGIQGRVLGFEPDTQKHCHSGEILYRPRQLMAPRNALLAALDVGEMHNFTFRFIIRSRSFLKNHKTLQGAHHIHTCHLNRGPTFARGGNCPAQWSRRQMMVSATMSLTARTVSFRKGAKRKK